MPLTPNLIAILEAAQHEMDAGDGEPMRSHLAQILAWMIDATYAAGRPELGEVPYKLREELTDIERGLLSLTFTPQRRRTGMRTWKVNLIALAVYAVDLAMAPERAQPDSETAAIELVLPIVQRAMPETTVTTIANWRRDLQRRGGPRDLPPEVGKRYATYRERPPPQFGHHPERQLTTALGGLRSSIRREQRPQRSAPVGRTASVTRRR